MKVFKFKTILKILISASVVSIILINFFFFSFIQARGIENWKTNAKRYVKLKDKELISLVFKNDYKIENNPYINMSYLTNLISNDIDNNENSLVDFWIISDNDELIYQYSSLKNNKSTVYSSEQILFSLKKLPLSIEETDLYITDNSNIVYIINSPYVNAFGYHKYNFIYIFDFSRMNREVFPVYSVILLILFTLVIFSFLLLLLYNYFKNYLNVIDSFIQNYFEGNSIKSTQLQFTPPFKNIEEKVTRIVSRLIEMDSKYYDLSEKFHMLLSQTNDGILMEDSEGFIYFCNRKAAEIFFMNDIDQLIGKRIVDLIHDPFSKKKFEKEKSIIDLSYQKKFKLLLENQNKEKKNCLFTSTCFYNSNKKISGYYYSITDLTDIVNLSNDNINQVSALSNYTEKSQFPVFIFDQDLKVYDLNNSAKNTFSVNYKSIKDASVYEIFKNYDFGKVLNQFDFTTNFKFDTFEPKINKWFLVTNEVCQNANEMYHYLTFTDISTFRKDESFHKLLFDDLKGFIFVTNIENEVIYVSPSFLYMTQYPTSWFINYFKSLNDIANQSEVKESDQFLITTSKGGFRFKMIALKSVSKSNKIYLCVLEQ